MKRKVLSVMLASAMLATMFAGCGNGNAGEYFRNSKMQETRQKRLQRDRRGCKDNRGHLMQKRLQTVHQEAVLYII